MLASISSLESWKRDQLHLGQETAHIRDIVSGGARLQADGRRRSDPQAQAIFYWRPVMNGMRQTCQYRIARARRATDIDFYRRDAIAALAQDRQHAVFAS